MLHNHKRIFKNPSKEVEKHENLGCTIVCDGEIYDEEMVQRLHASNMGARMIEDGQSQWGAAMCQVGQCRQKNW